MYELFVQFFEQLRIIHIFAVHARNHKNAVFPCSAHISSPGLACGEAAAAVGPDIAKEHADCKMPLAAWMLLLD